MSRDINFVKTKLLRLIVISDKMVENFDFYFSSKNSINRSNSI